MFIKINSQVNRSPLAMSVLNNIHLWGTIHGVIPRVGSGHPGGGTSRSDRNPWSR